MVAAICTQCGAAIEVDESKEAGICSHCGTAFITEKVINNYHIHNTTNVTNKIEHATINVKNGDDADDEAKRYRAFIKQKKYASAVKLLDKMEEKFPDSALTQYCKADFFLTSESYVNSFGISEDEDEDEPSSSGYKAAGGIFDLQMLSDDLDSYEKLSDAEIRRRLDKKEVHNDCVDAGFFRWKENREIDTEYKLRRLLGYCVPEAVAFGLENMFFWDDNDDAIKDDINCVPHYDNVLQRYAVNEIYFDPDYLYNRDYLDEEDFDPEKYATIKDFFKAKNVNADFYFDPSELAKSKNSGKIGIAGYANVYKRALFFADKTMEFGDSLFTDAERDKHADFLREIKEKRDAFAALVERREKAKRRTLAFRDELREKYKKELKAHKDKCKDAFKPKKNGSKGSKFIWKLLRFVIIAGVIVGVAVFLINKFL